MRKKVSLSIFIILIANFLVQPQSSEQEQPTWLIFEQGKKELEKGEYGQALHLFQKALERKSIYPEVELALGDIYRLEGEPLLAEKQYRKAYSLKSFFLVPEDRFIVLYRLAQLLKDENRTEELSRTLLSIIKDGVERIEKTRFENSLLKRIIKADDRRFLLGIYHFEEEAQTYSLAQQLNPEEEFRLKGIMGQAGYKTYHSDVFEDNRGRFLSTYLEKGIDRLLLLYRLDTRSMAKAHGELGEIYNRKIAGAGLEGNAPPKELRDECEIAITHYVFSLVILLSDALAEMHFVSPDYRFQGLSGFFKQAARRENVRGFLLDAGVFKYLYYLGVATHAIEKLDQPVVELRKGRDREIWELLENEPMAGRYQELARKQLSTPWVQPLLYID
ncbi:MAG TPA: hypothetical protein VMX75_01500 [Spirochaetia bacterium]|nr:hypothetical protein [Spirochaetia bacterium]